DQSRWTLIHFRPAKAASKGRGIRLEPENERELGTATLYCGSRPRMRAGARMFPDLTADDIFRIETKRLWLRWPRASDAPAITSFVSLAQVARMTASIPHPYPPGEAERFIMKARTGNAGGTALVLAITQKRCG